jgi:hypothetical protein
VKLGRIISRMFPQHRRTGHTLILQKRRKEEVGEPSEQIWEGGLEK